MENESSNENQTLEDAALAAANEASPAEGSAFPDKAIAAISEQRTRAQTAEIALAEMTGRNAVLEQQSKGAAPDKKSPLEIRAEEEGVQVSEVQLDGALYQAQRRYDAQIETAKAAEDTAKAAELVKERSREASRSKNADWTAIVDVGQKLLTPGELLDIGNAGADFGDAAYEKCKAAIERVKPKAETPAHEKKPSEPETETTTKPKHVPTQDEILAAVGGEDPVAIAASLL